MTTNPIQKDAHSLTDRWLLAKRPVLVDFYADWCGPCKAIEPVVDAISAKYADEIDVVKVDIEEHRSLATELGIRGVPTLMVFKNGEPVETIVGLKTREALEQIISSHL